MIDHLVRVHPSSEQLPRANQFAWALAELAAAERPVDPDAAQMVACRVVDNAAVALVSLERGPVANARDQALCFLRPGGATLFGLPASITVSPEWAGWANATAVRELDFHDTFLAADYAHPGDNVPGLIAVAQHCGRGGADLLAAIIVAYEVQVSLVKAISLHKHKKDHVAHLAPATVAGIGRLLRLPVEIIFQAINHAVHLAFSTRQSRKGEISSWKANVPGFSAKLAIEAVDRAMRGETAPSPIYEGEDSVIAWMLDGAETEYRVTLPEPHEPARAILETYTKAHSAEYQAQALIDLAIEAGGEIATDRITEIVLRTSHHTHYVIGSGANDPQKYDPEASRETLDHSIPYILAVALEDRSWHHVDSYLPERAHRSSTLELWRKIRTVEDPEWTKRYHEPDPARRAFGGTLEVRLSDGTVKIFEKDVADAHPNGAKPWTWPDYVGKFETLTGALIDGAERERFIGLASGIGELRPDAVRTLNPALPHGRLPQTPSGRGLFDWTAR
jgi:2-methylcitrate dehydratase